MFRSEPKGEIKALTDPAIPISEPDLPSITTPVVGWRSWTLAHGGGMLYSVSSGYQKSATFWAARKKLVALCCRDKENHIAPHPNCSCGIYAGKTELQIQGVSGEMVWGQVALWGRVLEQDDVYRAEFAYPVALTYINRAYQTQLHNGGMHTTAKLTAKELAKKLEVINLYYGVPVTSGSYDDFAAAQSRCYPEMGLPEEVKGLVNV